MQLSKHFSLEEMTRSMVAARKGIDNTPGAGEIKNYTGIDSPYELPVKPELVIDTEQLSIEDSVERVIQLLYSRAIIKHSD